MKKMADYVDRQAAIDELSFGKEMLSRVLDGIDVVSTDREKYSWGLGLIESSIKDIEELPSADVVEVVRCKDCVHYIPYDWMFSEVWKSQNIEDYPQNEIGCEWVDHYVKPNDYCSLGERKNGERHETD